MAVPAAVRAELPLGALERLVEPALLRPPCVVAFSGGRDSSLLLAAAVRAARRLGCAAPIAATLAYPPLPETEEAAWQRMVVDHLGVEDWRRLSMGDELDLVGPVAGPLLRRRGPYFPANLHTMVPMLEEAGGGSLIAGLGGDEALTRHRWGWLNDLRAGRRGPRPRHDLPRLALAALPAGLRGRLFAARRPHSLEVGWLTPTGLRALRRERGRLPDAPVAWNRNVAQSAASRALLSGVRSLRELAADHGAELHAPLVHPEFLAALLAAGGRDGWGGRTATMRAVAGEALPDEVLARRGKAVFNRAFFASHTREFASAWPGDGVDHELVDAEALRREWLSDYPDFRSGLLLQSAWLHAQAGS